jgi:hypothetical protein
MKELKPSISIKQQSQTSLPPNNDSTIMDDNVALMDDTEALMGGKTVITSVTKSIVSSTKPTIKIKIRH